MGNDALIFVIGSIIMIPIFYWKETLVFVGTIVVGFWLLSKWLKRVNK